jgi:hypothetical protein
MSRRLDGGFNVTAVLGALQDRMKATAWQAPERDG